MPGQFLVRDEQIFERRAVLRQQLDHLPFDFWEIFRVTGFDQHRGVVTDQQKRGIVGVVASALILLLQAVTEPENAGRYFAREGVCVCHGYLSSPRGT
jgi:hypothetical protein